MKALRDYAKDHALLDVMFPDESTHSHEYVAVVDRLLEHTHADVAALPPGPRMLLDILIAEGEWENVMARVARPHELIGFILRAWQLASFSPTRRNQAGPRTALQSWLGGIEIDFINEPDDKAIERINTAMFGPHWEAVAGFPRDTGPCAAANAGDWIRAIRRHTPPFMPGIARGIVVSTAVDLPDLGP